MQYNSMQRGLGALAGQMMTGAVQGWQDPGTYASTMSDLQTGRAREAQAQKYRADAAIAQDRLNARRSLRSFAQPAEISPAVGGGMPAGAPGSLGGSPAAGAQGPLAQILLQMMLSNESMNPKQFASGLQTGQRMGGMPQWQEAINSGDYGLASQINAMMSGKAAPKIYGQGGYGQTVNQFTGQQAGAGALPQQQQYLQAQAAAAQAQAQQRQFMTAGGDVYRVNQQQPQQQWEGTPYQVPPQQQQGPGVSLAAQDPSDFVDGGSNELNQKRQIDYFTELYQQPPFNEAPLVARAMAVRDVTNAIKLNATAIGSTNVFDTTRLRQVGQVGMRGGFEPAPGAIGISGQGQNINQQMIQALPPGVRIDQ